MEELIGKISLGLVTTAIVALIKMFSDLRVAQNSHKNLQLEVNEHKRDTKDEFRELQREYKAEVNEFKKEINQRFDKIETLLERLYKFELDRNRDRDRDRDRQ